jgi:hypothetical protein
MIMGYALLLIYASFLPTLVRGWPGPQALFYINGGLTMIVVLFIVVFIKETGHLTDREKKVVYAPEEYREKVKQMVLKGYCTSDFENLSKKSTVTETLT